MACPSVRRETRAAFPHGFAPRVSFRINYLPREADAASKDLAELEEMQMAKAIAESLGDVADQEEEALPPTPKVLQAPEWLVEGAAVRVSAEKFPSMTGKNAIVRSVGKEEATVVFSEDSMTTKHLVAFSLLQRETEKKAPMEIEVKNVSKQAKDLAAANWSEEWHPFRQFNEDAVEKYVPGEMLDEEELSAGLADVFLRCGKVGCRTVPAKETMKLSLAIQERYIEYEDTEADQEKQLAAMFLFNQKVKEVKAIADSSDLFAVPIFGWFHSGDPEKAVSCVHWTVLVAKRETVQGKSDKACEKQGKAVTDNMRSQFVNELFGGSTAKERKPLEGPKGQWQFSYYDSLPRLHQPCRKKAMEVLKMIDPSKSDEEAKTLTQRVNRCRQTGSECGWWTLYHIENVLREHRGEGKFVRPVFKGEAEWGKRKQAIKQWMKTFHKKSVKPKKAVVKETA